MKNSIFVTAIMPCAGKGRRLKSAVSKPLIEVGGQPIFIRTLQALSKHPWVKEIILAVQKKDLPAITGKIKRYGIKKIKAIVLGGRRRQDSIRNCLAFADKKSDIILIHDAARPFVTKEIISGSIHKALKYGAAVTGVKVKPTIKQVDKANCVVRTLDRSCLYEIQTPQAFKRNLIIKAFDRFGNQDATDDAALVERLGAKVMVVEGSYFNIKITTPEDFIFARAISAMDRQR